MEESGRLRDGVGAGGSRVEDLEVKGGGVGTERAPDGVGAEDLEADVEVEGEAYRRLTMSMDSPKSDQRE